MAADITDSACLTGGPIGIRTCDTRFRLVAPGERGDVPEGS
ncbi:hypothetical protein ACIPRD_30940 [Streptomyces sp. NPDC090108]